MSSQQLTRGQTGYRTAKRFTVTVTLLLAMAGNAAAEESANAVLPVATPESQGVSSKRLRDMTTFVQSRDLDVRSLLVVRHGRLVLEWYQEGITREHNHNVYSVTKSVVGLLAGIAIAEGKIDGIHSCLDKLIPEQRAIMDEDTRFITLEQLLTMRSGLPVSRGNRPSGLAARTL